MTDPTDTPSGAEWPKLLTADQLADIEMTAMNGFGHDSGPKRESVYRKDIMDLLSHIEALSSAPQGDGVMVPRETLQRWRGREYNSFEPDNQSSVFKEMCALLSAAPKAQRGQS